MRKCDYCGVEGEFFWEYSLIKNGIQYKKRLCDKCVPRLIQNGFRIEKSEAMNTETKNTETKNTKTSPKLSKIICLCTMFIVFGVIIVTAIISSSSFSKNDDNYTYYPSSSYTPHSSSSSSSSSSSRSSSQSSSSGKSASDLREKQKNMIDSVESGLKKDGQTTFRSGYTFEQCVDSARSYLKTKYSKEFYTTSVVVSTKDISTYFVTGYTTDGKHSRLW